MIGGLILTKDKLKARSQRPNNHENEIQQKSTMCYHCNSFGDNRGGDTIDCGVFLIQQGDSIHQSNGSEL